METAGLFPIPRTMGSFIILITILAFLAGALKNELALSLLGTVFLTVLVYCYLGVFFLGLLHRRKIRTLSLVISPETVPIGGEGELYVKSSSQVAGKGHIFRLPAIFARCELCLKTADSRVIRHYINIGKEKYVRFPVKERGAYFSGLHSAADFSPEAEHGSAVYDSFVVFDALGFFRLSLPIQQSEGVRLLVLPHPGEEPVSIFPRAGGTEQRNEPHYRKSDELTDHRPYVPGDDPRRINWKLYGHTPMGELFVREGESQPPPHSRLLILLDTEADSSLYTLDEARRAVDLLCETALAAALEFTAQGMDILIAHTSLRTVPDNNPVNAPLNAAEPAIALAWPAAIAWPRPVNAELPRIVVPRINLPEANFAHASRDRAVLILTLPRALFRTQAGSSALDLFLKHREARQEVDILFLYDAHSPRAAELENSAGSCVNLYNGKQGIHAKKSAAASSGKNSVDVPGQSRGVIQ